MENEVSQSGGIVSKVTVAFISLLLLVASFFFYPRWEHKGSEATISWDVSGYYWYLPAFFIYHDAKKQDFASLILEKYRPTGTDFQQVQRLEDGGYVMKYSSGMALMYIPYFTVAHLTAPLLGYPRDGFSPPYQFMIQLGGLVMSILGLWYLRKLLLHYFSDTVTAITIFLIACGTNYFNYAAIDNGMSHTWLFTLYVFLALATRAFYQSYRIKYALCIGLLLGLMVLVRPSELIACLIPALWGIESIKPRAIQNRLLLVWQKRKQLLLMIAAAFLVVSIQLCYWKYATGSWLFYSYGEQGFSWRHPHLAQYAFNYQCGWITYCPMMLVVIFAIPVFAVRGTNRVAIIGFLLLNYYVVSAWDIWWYGGRAMVQSYAIMVFPLATLVQYAREKRVMKLLFVPVAALILYFNFWMLLQYHGYGLYDGDSMSKKYFWRVVGRWHVPDKTKAWLDGPDFYEAAIADSTIIFSERFDTSRLTVTMQTNGESVKMVTLGPENKQIPYYSMPITKGKHGWVRAEAYFKIDEKEYDLWKMPKMLLRLRNKDQIVKDNVLRINRFLGEGQQGRVSIDMELPDAAFDSLTFTVWNDLSEKHISLGNVKVYTFN
jgi:hypothetical protein